MSIFKTPEQVSRERHTRELNKIQEQDILNTKISDIKEFIKNKPAQEKIKALEFFIKQEPFIIDDFTDYMMINKHSGIDEEINNIGILEIFKKYIPEIRWKWSFTEREFFIDEILKIYDYILFEESLRKTEKPQPQEKPKEEKPFAVLLNWKPETEELINYVKKLKGEIFNYNSIKDIETGRETLTLTGTNKNFDAIAFLYVMAEAGKVKVENPFATLQKVFNITGVNKSNLKLNSPLNNTGINKEMTLEYIKEEIDEMSNNIKNLNKQEQDRFRDLKYFVNRIENIKKILFSEKKLK